MSASYGTGGEVTWTEGGVVAGYVAGDLAFVLLSVCPSQYHLLHFEC